jgi:hypothetical protein
VQNYVAHGYGIGVTVYVEELLRHPEVRVLVLPDFPRVTFGVAWLGRQSPVVQGLIGLLQREAQRLAERGAAAARRPVKAPPRT